MGLVGLGRELRQVLRPPIQRMPAFFSVPRIVPDGIDGLMNRSDKPLYKVIT